MIDAVLFDMDGTLVRSDYDWRAIREELGITGVSIIDCLNVLPEPLRSAGWRRLREIEAAASDRAELVDGAREILNLLSSHGVKTALVTNNSSENTDSLVRRFGLRFDLIVTRDSGLFKPSGAPLSEAMRRLDVDPRRAIAVGDSKFDVAAGREAGCGWVAVVNGGYRQHRAEADLAFKDLRSLEEYLRGELTHC